MITDLNKEGVKSKRTEDYENQGKFKLQSTLVISTSIISNNRFSKRKSGPCLDIEL